MRVMAGRVRPEKAENGLSLLPKLEKIRLNHTTSGLASRNAFKMGTWLLRRFILQQRTTSKSGSSGWAAASSSAIMVKLTSGSACNSLAMWNPYSFSAILLGGKALTKQIFMRPRVPRSSYQQRREFQFRCTANNIDAPANWVTW